MAKKNGILTKIIIGALVTLLLAAVVWLWNASSIVTGTAKDIEYVTEEVAQLETDIEIIQPKVEKNTSRIDVVDRDIYYIQQDIEDIKSGIDTIIEKVDK